MLTIAGLRREYQTGTQTATDVIERIFDRIEVEGLSPVWISLSDRTDALKRAALSDPSLPLAGIPFAVKDNIDVEGMATTAGCPSFAYQAARSATVVRRLIEAGAILIGKTNLDQFATGLVGHAIALWRLLQCLRRTVYLRRLQFRLRRRRGDRDSARSPSAPTRQVRAGYPQRSTASSALKPTRGLVSTTGVVPACRSLDCVSIFANTADRCR